MGETSSPLAHVITTPLSHWHSQTCLQITCVYTIHEHESVSKRADRAVMQWNENVIKYNETTPSLRLHLSLSKQQCLQTTR